MAISRPTHEYKDGYGFSPQPASRSMTPCTNRQLLGQDIQQMVEMQQNKGRKQRQQNQGKYADRMPQDRGRGRAT
jgi:hypothetical protein